MGRIIAWQTLIRKQPTVILDPSGGIVQNIIDKISRLSLDERKLLWPRIVYVDVGATDYIVPTPLYHSLRNDTLFQIANRFPGVLKRQDPHLQSAPILGWNSLYECAIYAGQIAAALGKQLDFVVDLIDHPQRYKQDLRKVLERYPETAPAVQYFREFMDPNTTLRERRTASFRNKLLPFLADTTLLASVAASVVGVDWDAVIERKQTVIIDFQRELDPERRQFKMIWWFRSLIDYIKARGMSGRGKEIFFLIDEVTQLLGHRSGEGNSMLAEDLEELVAVLSRNYGVNTIIAHQNLSQVDDRVRNILMQCGTQVIGNIANPDDAYYLARQFHTYDPYQVKKYEPVWVGIQQFDKYDRPLGYSEPEVIDYRSVEFTAEEQLLNLMAKFRLPRFHFQVRPALAEGTVADRLYHLSIEHMDTGQYPNASQVTQTLAYLRQKNGVAMQELLKEIYARQKQAKGEHVQAQSTTPKPSPSPARIKNNDHHLPLFTQGEDDDFATLREEA
ncbi:MAG: hypothetical protein IT328_23755 [Caldilineaceae bacterium]|nr:hypothetical protein [Caldilineaceae bacterium]